MNLLEKLTSIDKSKIKRESLIQELEGVIFEYDEQVPDSVENAQTILDILLDLYPDLSSKEDENKKSEEKPSKDKNETDKKGSEKNEYDISEEDAKVILDNMTTPSYKPLPSIPFKEKGKGFLRHFLDDLGAKEAFVQKKPLFALTKKGETFEINSAAHLVQSIKNGDNHFLNGEEGIEEVKEEKKKENKKGEKDTDADIEAKKEKKEPEKKKITKENKKDCDNIVEELKTVLKKYQENKPKAKKEPAKKKPLATVVKESVVIIIKRVLQKEKSRNPKKDIDIKKFQAVVEKGKEFLKALRKASGGISDDNDQMIDSFEKQMEEIIETMQEKKAA